MDLNSDGPERTAQLQDRMEGAAPPSLFKKKRARGAQAAARSSFVSNEAVGEAAPATDSNSEQPEQAGDPSEHTEEGNVVVRRSLKSDAKAYGPVPSRPRDLQRSAAGTSASRQEEAASSKPVEGPSTSRDPPAARILAEDDADSQSPFVLRRSKLATLARLGQNKGSDDTSSRDGQYQASVLADLKASTPSAAARASLSREAYAVEPGGHHPGPEDEQEVTHIPDEAFVREAKLSRSRAANSSGAVQDDFISLGASEKPGLVSTSRGVTERIHGVDEAMDEFDKFAADEERLGLTDHARAEIAEQRRRRMQQAFENVHLNGAGAASSDDVQGDVIGQAEEEEDGMAWEQEQMNRWQDSRIPGNDHDTVSLAQELGLACTR